MDEMKDLNTRHKADDVAVAQRLVMSAEVLHVGDQNAIAFRR